MFNPHPPLAGFPIVLTVLVVGAEVGAIILPLTSKTKDSCKQFASVVLKILCCVAPVTYYAGYWAAEQANASFTVSADVISRHQTLGQLFLMSLLPTLLFSVLKADEENSSKVVNSLYYLFLTVTLATVVLTSSHGGDLVFLHGAGVSAPLPIK